MKETIEQKQKRLLVRYIDSYGKPIRNLTKVGRNAPCPCGSGKKYKHCCISLVKKEKLIANPDPAATA